MTLLSVWIIEMREGRNWLPTTGCSLSRADARRDLIEWQTNNPAEEFRIARYWRQS